MNPDRTPRCRPLPPHVVEAVRSQDEQVSEAELVHRLETALRSLPPRERSAFVAAVGYDEGAVGAAMEVELPPAEAAELAVRGLEMLRTSMAEQAHPGEVPEVP